MSNTLDKLEAEIKEMEAKMSPPKVVEDGSNPGENATPEAATTVNEEGVVETVQPIDQEDVITKPKRTDWKGKYHNEAKRTAGIKASVDKEKFETRQTIARLKAQVEELNKRQVVEVDPFENVFSQEDSDVVGDEAIEIVKRASKVAAERSTAKLRKEMSELKKEAADKRVRDVQNAEDMEYGSFLGRLESKQKNWKTINEDPEFLNYLSEVDNDSGYTRQELLRRAEVNGDVGRVVSFMKDFEAEANPGKRELEQKIGPTGRSTQSVQPAKVEVKILDGSYVDKYFGDVVRGVYKDNQVLGQKIQLEIETAIAERRVDFKR